MPNVIGEAEIVIKANAAGFQKDAEKKTASAGQRLGAGMARFAKRALRVGITTGVAAIGAAAGAAVIGGFRAAVSRQNSQKVLSGLYGSAKQATKMMTDLRKISSNSPIKYEAYQKAAQSLAYAGVEGDSATGTLRNVGKAIVAAGGDSSKMEQAMNGVMKAVNNGGIAMMDSLGMISESGVPILSGLAEKFGVPIDQVKKMASQGKISIDDVLSVMENGTGKTFQQMIKAGDAATGSFQNQWAIMKDNVANAVGDVMLPMIEKITPALEPIGNAIVTGIGKLPDVIATVGSVLKTLAPVIATVAAGFVAWNAGLLIHKGIAIATMVIESQWLTLTGLRVAAMNAMTIAQRALNSAMRANPIGIVLTLIVALVAGFVLAYNKIGWFRDGVNAVWAAIKTATAAVVSWFQTYVWPLLQAVWQGILIGARALWSGIQIVWNGIMAAVRAVVGWFQSYVAPVVQAVFSAVGAVMTWLYQNIVKPVFLGIQLYIKAWWTVVSAIFKALVAFFNAVLKPAFQIFGEVVRVVFQLITGIIKIWWAAVKIVFKAVVSFIRGTLSKAFTWFRDSVIKPVWNAIKVTINTVWTFIKTYVFKPIVSFIKSQLQPRFNFLKSTVNTVWNAIKAKISAVWNKYVKPIFSAIIRYIRDNLQARFNALKRTVTSVWNGIKNKISAVWKWVKKYAFDPLASAVKNTLPKAFRAGKNAIGKAWDGVKSVAKKPVRFVISTVINRGIISGFNKLAGKFGVKKIGYMKLPKGFDSGGWTGPGRKLQPAGVVHADEFVIRKAAQRKITRRHGRGALNYINQTGNLPGLSTGGFVPVPGYAKGGSVGTLSDAARWWKRKGARITEFKAWGQRVGTHSRNSLHYSGRAFDANYGPGGENATEKSFFDRMIPTFRKEFPKIGVIWRRPGHHNHAHFDTSGGAAVGSGGGDGGLTLDFFTKPFEALKKKIAGGVKGAGAFGKLVGGGAKKMIGMPIKWVTDNISKVADFVGDVGEFVGGGITKGVAYGKGQAWALSRGVTGSRKKAMNWIVSKESGWNPRAQNPRSTASGLPQMINSTARAYLGGAPAKKFGVWKQLDGMRKYVHDRYNGWIGAANFWKRNHHYADGGLVSKLVGNMPAIKPMLRDKGGILPPGMNLVNNATGRNEYVVPPNVTDALLNGNLGSGGDTYINVELKVDDLAGLQSALEFVEMLKRDKKTERVRTRMTAKSGEVNA